MSRNKLAGYSLALLIYGKDLLDYDPRESGGCILTTGYEFQSRNPRSHLAPYQQFMGQPLGEGKKARMDVMEFRKSILSAVAPKIEPRVCWC
jgi:hypothetical protein